MQNDGNRWETASMLGFLDFSRKVDDKKVIDRII